MAELFKQAEAVTERNIEWLVYLIRRPPRSQEIRDHLADVIEGLLSKKISLPNRKPKQDSEDKCLHLAARVLEVKKEKGWKLRAVVDFVAKEMRCSPSTAWAAWRDFGPALLAGDHFRQRYDIDALVDTIMTAGREGRKLGEEKGEFRETQRRTDEYAQPFLSRDFGISRRFAAKRSADRSLQKSPHLVVADRIGRS